MTAAVRGKRPGWAMQHCKAAYRSGLELAVSAALALAKVPVVYEQVKVPFVQPAKARTYHPDFLLPNGILVETKGMFDAADREKHLLVRAQHPNLDIRFVFTRSKAPISKGSKTTYGMWCDKHFFQYADKNIPEEWLTEPPDPLRVAAVAALQR